MDFVVRFCHKALDIRVGANWALAIVLIFGGASELFAAQSLEQKKAELEAQLREIEVQQKQKEAEEKAKIDAQLRQQAMSSQKYQAGNNNITQEMRDSEVKDIFGLNRNGVLLGISYATMNVDYKYQNSLKGDFSMLGLKLGYQRFPGNKAVGFRAYIDAYAGYADTNKSMAKATQTLAAYNLDVLLDYNIPNTWHYVGIFGGLGYGVMQFDYSYTSLIYTEQAKAEIQTLFYNVGLALTFDARHRIELYAKIPAVKNYDEKFHYATSPLLSAAYQFTF